MSLIAMSIGILLIIIFILFLQILISLSGIIV